MEFLADDTSQQHSVDSRHQHLFEGIATEPFDDLVDAQLGPDRARCRHHHAVDRRVGRQAGGDRVDSTEEHAVIADDRDRKPMWTRRATSAMRAVTPTVAADTTYSEMRRRSPTEPSVGNPSAVHAARPPTRSTTFSKPSCSNRHAARELRSQCWSKQ